MVRTSSPAAASARRGHRTLLALLGLVGMGACSDPFQPRELLAVVGTDLELFALNGSPPGAPNALALLAVLSTAGAQPAVFRVTDAFNFDMAVDFTPSGPVLVPVKLVGSVLGGQRDVGLRKMDVAFDALTEGPNDGYSFSTTLPIAAGDVIAAVSVQSPFCQSQFVISSDIYGKLRVVAIDPVARTVQFQVVVDPNCGSRRLVLPTPAN